MPRTGAGLDRARLPPPSRTAAVAGFASSAKSWSSGSDELHLGAADAVDPSTVLAISPSSARW